MQRPRIATTLSIPLLIVANLGGIGLCDGTRALSVGVHSCDGRRLPDRYGRRGQSMQADDFGDILFLVALEVLAGFRVVGVLADLLDEQGLRDGAEGVPRRPPALLLRAVATPIALHGCHGTKKWHAGPH